MLSGHEPLIIQRSYHPFTREGQLGKGWVINHDERGWCFQDIDEDNFRQWVTRIIESTGSQFQYEHSYAVKNLKLPKFCQLQSFRPSFHERNVLFDDA